MIANLKITDPLAQPIRETLADIQIIVLPQLAQLEQRLKTVTDSQPKTKKAQEKRHREIRQLTHSVENFKAFLTLSEGQQVTNGVQLGIITKLALSPGGMPEVWVSWYGHVLIPEQPKRLKSEPFFKHFKVGDTITINSKHPEAAQKSFEIKEFRGDGWIITKTNQLFHHDFIELTSVIFSESEQDLSSSGTAISEHDGEVVEETVNEIVEDVQEIGSEIPETVEKNKEISETLEETNYEQSTIEIVESPETSNSTGKTKTPKGISFGKTINQLYQGKTCTRRIWSERTIKTFINYFEQGVKVPAYDKGLQYGGEIIGWLTLTQKPYQDELINMTQADLKAEGFPDYTFDQFINEFFDGKNQTIWVIWFEFSPNQPSQESINDNDSFATFLENSAPDLTGADHEIIHLDLEEVRRDGGTQPRTKIDLHHIKRLEEQMEDGQEIEPVVVFFDGTDYWLADGFHRWNAHRNQQEPTIRAIIYQGSRRDAVLYSVGANADHKPALPRSRADKRRAAMTLLQDKEWKAWSDNEIARQCKVSQPFISKLRKTLTNNIISDDSIPNNVYRDSDILTNNVISEDSDLTNNVISEDDARTYRTKHGTITTMNIANIGKTQEEEMTDTTIKVTTDEILIAFLSNLEYMSEAQVEAAVKAIANYKPEMIKRLGLLDG